MSEILSQGMGVDSVVTDLCVKAADIQLPNIHEDDFAVIAMPVFAGRVPALAVERLRMVKSNGAKCVVVAVFGNRAYDDPATSAREPSIKTPNTNPTGS